MTRKLSADALIRWLGRVYPADERKQDGHKSVLEALLWYCAYNEASQWADLSTKEVAHALQAGWPGYRVKRDLSRWLSDCYAEAEGADLQATTDQLLRDLSVFFKAK